MLDNLAPHGEALLRLLLASGLGAVIGLEREAAGKAAGFRTNLLICLGAALITQISAAVAADHELPGGIRADPGRIAAQIVSGIGFLGAGTILQSRGSVTGLTTAATLWVVAAIGMAVGAGLYLHALAGTGFVMLALMILGRFEDFVVPARPAERSVRVVLDNRADRLAALEATLTGSGLPVTGFEVERREDVIVATFRTKGPPLTLDTAVLRLIDQPGVRKVSLL